MIARFALIAAVALASASGVAAEPGKPASQPAQAQSASPRILLASAESVRTPQQAEEQAPSAPKRRIGRVTSCRCGDPQAQPNQQ